MSIRVVSAVWEQSRAKGSGLLLLLAIADFAHDDGTGAYPSNETLAAKIRMSPRQVRNLVGALESLGELAVQRDPGGVNRYTVLVGRQSFPGCAATEIAGVPRQYLPEDRRKLPPTPAIAIASDPSINRQDPLVDPSGGPARAKRGVAPLTEKQRAKLVADFEDLSDVGERIDLALSHKASAKSTNQYLYVRQWLRNDRERGGSNGRSTARRVAPSGGQLSGGGLGVETGRVYVV